MNDPTARVLQLLSLLQTHRFWPGNELADRLEVSPRTLRRDVERLRELGYLVDATPGTAGGYRLAAGNHLPPLLLDDEEAVAIAVGLRGAADAPIDGIEETSVRAMAKLEQVLPDRLRRRVVALHSNVEALRWSRPGPLVDPEALALLSQACRDSEQVHFDYERRDGERSRRLVEPHQLVVAGRRWYLVAWDVRRDDWRTFRLDRLAGARLAGPRFAPRTLPTEDAASFVERSIGAMPAAHQLSVTIDAPAPEVAESVRWLGDDLRDLGGGRCRVELKADSIERLAGIVSQLAMGAQVHLEPGEAATLVAAHLARLSERLASVAVG
ncbi:helix-turn-helix transcriptional regulator [Dermatobacter hominis]|uniref:helix-turn-helix transcriptional regulator n=1 Tax=Dermatobacter hominis TaxID=2884263 RepID=UPI001D10BECA|nr:YafY family protein [Dermatobacter hominis]UDY34661.1 YafY family transcriptional regulator [Dermatobacter hominis]